MSFAFSPSEEVEAAAKRIAREGVRLAIAELSGEGEDDPVHETRRIVKRLRALGRLLRDALGDDAFRASDRALRDVGRSLADARDAAVVLATFDALAEKKGAPENAAAIRRLLVSDGAAPQPRFDEAIASMRSYAQFAASWSFAATGFAAIAPGLRRTYARGRRALVDARETWAPESVHALRKCAKDLTFEVNLLEAAWPAMLEPQGAVLSELGDRLGEDHDLAVLGERLRGREEAAAWLVRIAERRRKLRREATPLAEKIYAERPKIFVERIGAWWRA